MATRSAWQTSYVHSLQKTLEDVRDAAGLPNFHFHLLRHYFISWCVMGGVDILSIARWVGHEGGMLISKVYAHLSSEHTQQAGSKVVFGVTRPIENNAGQKPGNISVAELLQLVQQLQAKNGGQPEMKAAEQHR